MTLSTAQLDALPPGSAVRCTTERGMRTSLALKLGGYGLGANSWVTTDGTTFPSSFAIAQADAVLLVPSAVATAPALLSDTCAHATTQTHTGITTCLACTTDIPTPVSDTRATVVADDVKMLRETLCEAQTAILNRMAPSHALPHADRLQALVAQLDVHRPLGPDGKHGDRHTATCGCDDAPVSDTRREDVARALYGHRSATGDFPDGPTLWEDLPESWREEWLDAADAVLAVLPAPPVVDEAEVRERIAQEIEADMTVRPLT